MLCSITFKTHQEHVGFKDGFVQSGQTGGACASHGHMIIDESLGKQVIHDGSSVAYTTQILTTLLVIHFARCQILECLGLTMVKP